MGRDKTCLEHKQNSEAAKHALIVEAHIPDATEDEIAAVMSLIAKNARSSDERGMFESMLLGGIGVAKCSCGQTYVVQSLVRDCTERNHVPNAGESEDG